MRPATQTCIDHHFPPPPARLLHHHGRYRYHADVLPPHLPYCITPHRETNKLHVAATTRVESGCGPLPFHVVCCQKPSPAATHRSYGSYPRFARLQVSDQPLHSPNARDSCPPMSEHSVYGACRCVSHGVSTARLTTVECCAGVVVML